MFKKKLESVKIDKQSKNIYIKQKSSKFSLMFKKYNKMFLLLVGISSIAMLTIGFIMAVSVAQPSEKLVIKEVSIDTDIDLSSSDVTSSLGVLTDATAKENFQNSSKFKQNGEALLVKTVSKGKYVIRFYSDYTAVKAMKNIIATHYGTVPEGFIDDTQYLSEDFKRIAEEAKNKKK